MTIKVLSFDRFISKNGRNNILLEPLGAIGFYLSFLWSILFPVFAKNSPPIANLLSSNHLLAISPSLLLYCLSFYLMI